MIDIKALVPQLQKQVGLLTEDLIGQAKAVEATSTFLREHYDKAIEAGRLSQSFEEWSEDYLEQVAVSWVLSCVFVRFLEDNHLIDECWIAGEGDRGKLADGHYEIYFRSYPHHTDREYLKYAFKEVGKIPAARELFDDDKTPLWAVDPSGDAARRLLLFFKEIDAERGGLRRQFDTREVRTQPLVDVYEELAPQAQFLGDLYQDLSEHARKKYALLQTPEFVLQFILDRTLTPAIAEVGLKGLRLIDAACGSGHFLLGAFDRLFALWMKSEDIRGNPVVAAQNAFDSIFGVDINPFAIAITRFRMLVAAVRACGINRLHQQSYAWKLNLAVGDSLLRGSRPTFGEERHPILIQKEIEFEPVQKLRTEDPKAANEILGQGYHVVVGNPPYIIMRDRAQNAAYRQVYSTCHQKYSLGVPFTQRFWDLAIRKGERVKENAEAVSPAAGFVGMITANSFMKREFGKKLIEEFFPKIDLTHVIDTSGAYIPGHGTPTVILFGRSRKPVDNTVRAVLGIKGEQTAPEDPSQGQVWLSITKHIDATGSSDEFTSTTDVPRVTFNNHPWSIGGGGAAELKERLEESNGDTLENHVTSIGFPSFPGLDDAFVMDASSLHRKRADPRYIKPFVYGEGVRDWKNECELAALAPYDEQFTLVPLDGSAGWAKHLWLVRTNLQGVVSFGGKTRKQCGDDWWGWYRWVTEKYRNPLSIAFTFFATHNHCVVDRGGKVFKHSIQLVKLIDYSSEEKHLGLAGILNCSVACFWLKMTCHDKGGGGIGGGLATESWEHFFDFTGTHLQRLPIPPQQPLTLASRLDELGKQVAAQSPEAIARDFSPNSTRFEAARGNVSRLIGQMIALQEELDWECYRHYGLLADDLRYAGDDLPEMKLSERAFEIVMARQMKRGDLQTTWFERHGSTPITEVPPHWPVAYRTLVERRIKLIESNKEIGLIERPEYKRRWNTEPWAEQVRRASANWLLDRLEAYSQSSTPELTTAARLADRASCDSEFMQVAALYRGRPDFDTTALVAELVEAESVPLLPALRYKPSGLRKREVWERTWDLQRREDAGEEVGDIPVPPKYTSADFLKPDYWRLRGKLDVPKERWVSYPHCQTDSDPSLVVGWAGWDHLEQATAIVTYYDARKREGWDARRLTPLLAGLDQLLPWIHQWHPEVDSEFGETAGKSYQTLLEQDTHELGLTLSDVRNWQPPEKARKGRAPRKKQAAAEDDE